MCVRGAIDMAHLAEITDSAKEALCEGGITAHENLCINCILQQRAKSTATKRLNGDAHTKDMGKTTASR